MSWTEHFRGVDYKKRAEYLLNYLKQRPNELAQKNITDPFTHGYKVVLSFIVGSLCVRTEYRYISKGAREQLKKYGIDVPVYEHMYDKGKHPECENLTHEHTIPTSVIVDYLASMDEKKLEVGYLTKFIEKVSGIALITDEENNALDGNGLRKKLPSGITLDDILQGKAPHSARYDAADIKMADTNHQAKA